MGIIKRREVHIILSVVFTALYALYNTFQILLAIIAVGVQPVKTTDILISISLIAISLLDKVLWYNTLKNKDKGVIVCSIITYIVSLILYWSYLITL